MTSNTNWSANCQSARNSLVAAVNCELISSNNYPEEAQEILKGSPIVENSQLTTNYTHLLRSSQFLTSSLPRETIEPLSQFAQDYLIQPVQSFEEKLNYYLYDIWQETGDERTNKLPFVGAGPWKLIYATLIYLYLIKWLVPRLMQTQKPFELNWIIRAYNLSMVLCNIWAFYHGTRILKFGLKCFGCETINHKDYSPSAIELLHYGWLFFMSRLVEWLDTVFFVLRKKEKQVTKLHVFHHAFVPLISWTYLKYHPGYTMAFFPLINSLVHSIMYTYYLLATFGNKIQPYLWWKRYLTSLQIAQFVLILIQLASIPLTANEQCQYPRGFLYVAFAGAILFLWLFYTYYIETYSPNRGRTVNHSEPSDLKGEIRDKVRTDSSHSSGNPVERNARKVLDKSVSIKDMLQISKSRIGREGNSRALADAIENAIGSFCEITTEATLNETKKKVV